MNNVRDYSPHYRNRAYPVCRKVRREPKDEHTANDLFSMCRSSGTQGKESTLGVLCIGRVLEDGTHDKFRYTPILNSVIKITLIVFVD
jgi:hypothetical protein